MIESLTAKSVNAEELIQAWRRDPILAAKDIFDVELDIPQRISLREHWNNVTHYQVETRGGGKTFKLGLYASLRALLYPHNKIGLISASGRQSRFIFDQVENLYNRSPIFQEATAQVPVHRPEACVMQLHGANGRPGSSIEAIPLGADGGKVRGFRFYDVVVDEAAQISESIINTVIVPFLSTAPDPMGRVKLLKKQKDLVQAGKLGEADIIQPMANRMCMATTAFYQFNHIWKRLQRVTGDVVAEQGRLSRAGKPSPKGMYIKGLPLNGQFPGRVIRNANKEGICIFPWQDFSEGFMEVDRIKQSERDTPQSQHRMEWECYFPSDSDGFFRRSKLEAARSHGSYGPSTGPRPGAKYVLGIDPARVRARFAVVMYEVWPDAGVAQIVRVWSWQDEPFPQTHQHVREIIMQWNVADVVIDSGGGGRELRDLLADPRSCPAGQPLFLEVGNHKQPTGSHHRRIVRLVEFSSAEWCTEMNTGLLSAIEHGRVTIASRPPIAGEPWMPAMDDYYDEIDSLIEELSSIVTFPAGNRVRWDTASDTQRKDRYSAAIVGFDGARELLKPKAMAELLIGRWL